MIGALTGAASILTSAAGGAATKVIAVAVSDFMKGRREAAREKHERKLAEKNIDIAAYHDTLTLGTSDVTSLKFILWTRRLLAWTVVISFCYISVLWAHHPSTIITTFVTTEPGNFAILWGLIQWPIAADTTVQVSTGAIVWGLMDFAAFIITMYFTPAGKQ